MPQTDDVVERLRLFGVSRPNLGLSVCDEAADEIERLREENVWRTIESAPRDGTNLLVACEGGDFPLIGFFHKGDWYSVEGSRTWPQPTHWRHLPAPPSVEGRTP